MRLIVYFLTKGTDLICSLLTPRSPWHLCGNY